MVNLLFGSSNAYRNYSRALGHGLFAGRDLQLINCTQKTVLDASLSTLQSACLIVLSVLENFVVSACSSVNDEEVQLFARQQITAIVNEMYDVVQRIPGLNVIIMPPMYRSDPPWFGPYLPDLTSFLSADVTRINSSQLAVCSPFLVDPSMLERDGVHLTASAGDRLLAHLDAQLGTLIVEVSGLPAIPDDRLDQILAIVNWNSTQLDSFQAISETVSELSRASSGFESYVRRRFKDDNLIFARMKEESDTNINRSLKDRVVITGLVGPSGSTSTHAEKKALYTEIVTH